MEMEDSVLDKKFAISPQDHAMDESKTKLILEGMTRSFPGNASVVEYFQAGLAEGLIRGDKPALIEDERTWTFKELDSISSRLARAIRLEIGGLEFKNLNPDADTVVGLCIPPSERLILFIFAVLKLGCAYVPFDHTFPEDRVKRIVENCRPVLIISDPHTSTITKFDPVLNIVKVTDVDTLIDRVLTKKGGTESGTVLVEAVDGNPDHSERVAIVLYTSGSSGAPKGVRITHRAIMNRLYWQWKQFPFSLNERCCFKTNLTFVDSVAEIFGPLLQGQVLHVFGRHITGHPNVLIQKIADNRISRLVIVPSLLKAMLHTVDLVGEEARKDLESVLLWVCSGETLTKGLVTAFFAHFPKGKTICNFYGSTEIMGDVTFETFACEKELSDKVDGIHVPLGKCVFNTIIYILDETMALAPEGETGELYVAGHNLALGYVGSSNNEKFMTNPYTKTVGFDKLFRTGDFGRVKRPKSGIGVLFYEGRQDSQIKIRGYRIDVREIEAALAERTDLVEKVVVLVYHPEGQDQTLVAFVLPKDPDITVSRIEMMMKTKLKPYEIPEVKLVPDIPYLVNGKVDRQRLLLSYEDRRLNRSEFDDWQSLDIPPHLIKGAIALIQTIASVTGTSEHDVVGDLEDSFYNVGGTSLNSILVCTKLREKKYQISIADFISAKCIRDMFPKISPASAAGLQVSLGLSENSRAKYYSEAMDSSHEAAVINIIAYSFSHKGDLEVYTHATYNDFEDLIGHLAGTLIAKGLSYVVRQVTDKKVVAVCLNFDMYDEPENIMASKGIRQVLEFLEYLESKQREKLPKGKGKLLHNFMMGTHESVDESENVYVVAFMEELNITRAKDRKFLGIVTTNTNALTQQICEEVLGYEQLISFQVNKYVAADGSKPFLLAPDDQTAVVCWKKLDHLHKEEDH